MRPRDLVPMLEVHGVGQDMKATPKDCLDAAQKKIDAESVVCFDICAQVGQIFGNVSHMYWFRASVANHLIRNTRKYAHLPLFKGGHDLG